MSDPDEATQAPSTTATSQNRAVRLIKQWAPWSTVFAVLTAIGARVGLLADVQQLAQTFAGQGIKAWVIAFVITLVLVLVVVVALKYHGRRKAGTPPRLISFGLAVLFAVASAGFGLGLGLLVGPKADSQAVNQPASRSTLVPNAQPTTSSTAMSAPSGVPPATTAATSGIAVPSSASLPPVPSAQPVQPASISLRIPHEGQVVYFNDLVVFDVRNIPAYYQVWVWINFDNDAKANPQGPCRNPDGGIEFTCRDVQFGVNETPRDQRFDVVGVIIKDTDSTAYENAKSGFDIRNPPAAPVAISAVVHVKLGKRS